MQCPKHKTELQKLSKGMSYVCPVCDYKAYDPQRYWVPDCRHVIDLPSASAWTNWTLTNVEADVNNALVLSTGNLTGTAVSPQIINLTKHADRYFDCTRIKPTFTDSRNGGTIEYYASNDGGNGYRLLRREDVIYNLPDGHELPQYKQQRYDDLRIKVELSRTSSGATSPSVSRIHIVYNKVKL